MARHRSGPTTAPLDLTALAAAPAEPRTRPIATVRASAVPTAAAPTAARSHRAAPARLPILASTRTAGVLALAGALAGAGLATTATSTAAVADGPSTGELGVSELVNSARATPAASDRDDDASTPTRSSRAASAPAATTSTAAASPDDGGRTLWSADFASAGLGNFKRTPWNVVGAKTPKVSDGVLGVSMPGGGKRAEVEPDFKNLREGDEYYFGFSVRLADDFPADGGQWQVITQWKNQGTGTPPLEVKVQDGHFVLDGDGGSFSQVVGDAKPGRWTHLVMRVAFSASNGSVSAWQDGASTLSDYSPSSGTLYSGKSSYLKVGLYRDSSISSDGALQFGSYAIGTSRGAVSKDVTRGR